MVKVIVLFSVYTSSSPTACSNVPVSPPLSITAPDSMVSVSGSSVTAGSESSTVTETKTPDSLYSPTASSNETVSVIASPSSAGFGAATIVADGSRNPSLSCTEIVAVLGDPTEYSASILSMMLTTTRAPSRSTSSSATITLTLMLSLPDGTVTDVSDVAPASSTPRYTVMPSVSVAGTAPESVMAQLKLSPSSTDSGHPDMDALGVDCAMTNAEYRRAAATITPDRPKGTTAPLVKRLTRRLVIINPALRR